MKKLIYSLLVVTSLLIMQCTNDRALPGGFESLQREYKGEVIVQEYRPIKNGLYRTSPEAGYRSNLLIGRFGQTNSNILFRLRNYRFSVIDTADVLSATVNLQQLSRIGDGAAFTVKAYLATKSWDESKVTGENFQASYDPGQLLGSFEVPAQDTAFLKLSLPVDLIHRWMAKQDTNGIYLAFDNAEFMANIASSDAYASWGNIFVKWRNKSGTTDSLSSNIDYDASLLSEPQSGPENVLQTDVDRLKLSNSSGHRSLLRFDVSDIPREATILQANFSLSIDPNQSRTSSSGLTFSLLKVINDSTWQLPIKVDSLISVPTGIGLGDQESMVFSDASAMQYLSRIIQTWLLSPETNCGLLLSTGTYAQDPYYISFYTGKDQAEKMPVLRISYSLPSSTRF